MLPLVSVRIPSYNHEKYICDCLDSVIQDEYPNKELLIMDDGSSDNTVHVIHDWVNSRQPKFPVRIFERPHRGLCETLNELIPLCNGEFLVSLASDDVLIPGGIQSRVDYLLSHEEKDAVIADCSVIDKEGNVIFHSGLQDLYTANISNYQTNDGLAHEIIWNWSIPGPVLMTRNKLYASLGMYDSKLTIEDWDLYLRMVAKEKLGFINTVVSAYRVHDKNTCGGKESASQQWELARVARKNLFLFQGKQRRLLFRKMLVLYYLFIQFKYFSGL